MPDRRADTSNAAFEKARNILPGGVSSPDRSPLFIKQGSGCTITDLDGNEYIDFVCGNGAIIVGHAHERVVAALSKAIGRGTCHGANSESETQLASKIISAMPSIEMIRFTSSGTEAAMTAIRLARAATNRNAIAMCSGAYHGHADVTLAEPSGPRSTHAKPSSPGIPPAVTHDTFIVSHNDLEAAQKLFEMHGKKLAAFILEPIASRGSVLPPAPGYLDGLRTLCDRHGALLIFDEVLSGFRVAWGGAQTRYHVRPDLTCLGKIIGGGLPVGALGGRRDLTEQLTPAGSVFHAGTFAGNPLSMAGGLATLEILAEPGVYETLEERSEKLAKGIAASAADRGAQLTVNRVGSMLGISFTDIARFRPFVDAMLDRGIHLAPNPANALFVSLAHDDAAIDRTIEAVDASFDIVTKE